MSLKQEIETWVTALAAYDNNEFDVALKNFEQIADTSRILFNVGVIHATLGQHAQAVDCYQRAVQLDQYLAVAYFQSGVSSFLMGDFEEALANFNDALLYLRGNSHIDYEQLGLKFKLYSCEVLFNRGLCYIYLQQKDAGMQDLIYAAKEKCVPDHDVIDEAIKEQAEGYTVFSIPVGVVYRPNEAKVKNLKTKDYLGKARLVAAQDTQHSMEARRAALAALGIDDRPGEQLSYAALNLVRPDLRSRSGRQQSAPPLNRYVFPPTPPPEPDRPESAHDKESERPRSASRNHSGSPGGLSSRQAAKPMRLDLGPAAFEQKASSPQKPRIGTKRSESERPAIRRDRGDEYSHRRSDGQRLRSERNSPRGEAIPEVRVQEDPIEAYSEQANAAAAAASRQQPAPQPLSPQQQQSQQQKPSHQRTRSTAHAKPTVSIPIIEEDEGDGTQDYAEIPLAFEIIPPKPASATSPLASATSPLSGPRHRSQSRRAAPPPDLRSIRVKVHVADDTRYVMVKPEVTFVELSEQIRAKFQLPAEQSFKMKIKDEEGDLVTIGDQDDLDHAVGVARATAAKARVEMGKLDLWVQV